MKNWEANWNRDVLEHIVALLFALAGLADLATGLPCHRRRHVLAILSHGEAEARAFLVGGSTDAPVPAEALARASDAARLAAHLRTLALLLCAMLAQAPSALRVEAHPQSGRRPVHKISGLAVRRPASSRAPDTS